MAIVASKIFMITKVTSSKAQPDDHWIKSLMLILLSYSGMCFCKSETFRSLYSHTVFILGESFISEKSMSKSQFKDPLTGTCQIRSDG